MRVLIWLAAALLFVGCESGEVPPRGVRGGVPLPTLEMQPKAPREPVDPPRPEPLGEVPLPVEDHGPGRDLGAELKAAIGTPTDCISDFVASTPTTLRVSVSATVRPTGMLITPSVYGSGISNEARQCIARRVQTVVLRPLDDSYSQTVSTIIEMQYEPEVIVEALPGVPEPDLRNVREPLPKYPMIPLDAKIIDGWPTSNWISGGFDGGIPMPKDTSKRVRGPKPVPIDGYEVFENAQIWTDQKRRNAPSSETSD